LLTRNNLIRITCALLIAGVVYAEETDVHLVGRGETFSQLAFRYFGRPVYEKRNGSLAQLKRLNPQIDDPDRIYAGQELVIPVREARKPASLPVAAADRAPINSSPPEAPERPERIVQAREEEVAHRLTLAGGLGFSVLAAEDLAGGSAAELQTSRDLFAKAQWEQVWSESFSSHAALSVRNLDFQPSTNAAKALVRTHKTLFGLSAGGEHRVSEKISLHYGAGIGQELFLSGVNSAAVGVDALAVPRISAGARVELARKGSTAIGVDLSASHFFPATGDTYSVKAGKEFGGELYLRKEQGESRAFGLRLGIRRREQESSLVTIGETGIYGGISFSFPFPEGEKKE
jgi:hypothetical protein